MLPEINGMYKIEKDFVIVLKSLLVAAIGVRSLSGVNVGSLSSVHMDNLVQNTICFFLMLNLM